MSRGWDGGANSISVAATPGGALLHSIYDNSVCGASSLYSTYTTCLADYVLYDSELE